MTNEEKQALIERINKHIEWLKKEAFNQYNDHAAVQEEVTIYEVALAALTAKPVKLPAPYGMQDHERWLKQSEVESAIRAAGYEVQE